jgi:hypothetical protein
VLPVLLGRLEQTFFP